MHSLKKCLQVLGCGVLAVTLTACAGGNAGTRLTAAMPRDEAFRKEFKKELSSLNVAVEMSAAEMTDTLNRVVPKELYRGSTGTSGLSAVVSKSGPISVTIADNNFYLTVPVSISLSYGVFQTPAMRNNLKFKVSARVTQDWRLEPQVYYTGLSDSLAEEMRIGPISFKPRSIFDGLIQPVQRMLSNLAASKVNEKLALKNQVQKAWAEAQKPIQLDKNYHAWLVMTPRDAVLYPIYGQNNRLKVSVGLTSYADVVVGPQPPARAAVPLPRLTLASGSEKTFRVAVNSDLFYHELVNIASPLLLNKELGQDGRSVILKGLEIYGNGDHLMVRVETTGSVDGIFYLTCKPVFDPRTNVLSVEDLDFDIDSRNLLLRSADWFLHGTFRRAIQEKLNVDLTQRLAQAREMAGKSMSRVQLADNVFLSGKVKDMRLNDLMVQKDKLSVRVYLEGESTILFH